MSEPAQRLDKWLWYARCARTRTAAQRLIEGGGVRINGEKTRSNASLLRAGDVLTLTGPRGLRILRVEKCGERRGPATEAALLYSDKTPQLPRTEAPANAFEHAIRSPGAGRPTKRERRETEHLIRRD
jgi:ribosome-associated heat shock protein Hsp15